MEKTLYECSFYLKDKKGSKVTEYLTAYFFTEYSRYAENLLIATYANGEKDRIYFSSPQTVRDQETLLKKDMVYVLFQFQLGDENGNRMKTTFNYMFTDIIMASNIHKAEMLLDAKYGQGNPKRIISRSSRTYKYDELRNITSKYETYEFTFYLKDEKGNKTSEMMTMSIDDTSYYKAEEKLIAILANGDKNRIWHSSGKTIGLALPSLLRQEYEEEQKRLSDERTKKQAERIKSFVSFVAGKASDNAKTATSTADVKQTAYSSVSKNIPSYSSRSVSNTTYHKKTNLQNTTPKTKQIKEEFEEKDAVIRRETKKKTTCAVLCFLLGLLGVHRFYVGKVATGFIWLISLGLFGVGWVIDLMSILMGHFTDKQGNRIR